MDQEIQEIINSPKKRKRTKVTSEQVDNMLSQYKRLVTQRTEFESTWERIAKLFCPRKSGMSTNSRSYGTDEEADIYDTTGPDALNDMAAGLMSLTTPKSEPWFSLDAPKKLKNIDEVRKWLSACTQSAYELLADSNFYTERHEAVLDKILFGTSALLSYINPDDDKTCFEHIPIGTYVIEENHEGHVDTLMRQFQFTAKQLVQKFGEEAVSKEVRELYDNLDNKLLNIIHIVRPRSKKEIKRNGLVDKDQKEFGSYYIEESTKNVLQEGGYDSFPYHVGRYAPFTGSRDKTVWGYGIGQMALPDVQQINYLQALMEDFLEKEVNPPLLVSENFKGKLDLGPEGVNFVSAMGIEGQDQIRPISTTGNLENARYLIDDKRQKIERKFHMDMFKMFSMRDGKQPLSATEANARMAEKLQSISPSFDRDVAETITPMLKRLFIEWLKRGLLPAPPESAYVQKTDTSVEIDYPEVVMSGRLALAIRNLRNLITDQQLARIANIAQFDPNVLDNLDTDAIVRGTAFDSDFVAAYLRDSKDVKRIREDRQQAQAQQQQAQMALEAAKVVPDKVIEKEIDNAGGIMSMLG